MKIRQSKQNFLSDSVKQEEVKHKLELAEIKYRNLFEKSHCAIILGNSQGKIIECNSKTITLFGYQKNEVIGKDFRDFPIFSPEDLVRALSEFKHLLKGEKPQSRDFNVYKKDGTRVWVNSSVSIIKYNSEPIYQIILQDISENKKAEDYRKEIEEELKKNIKTMELLNQIITTVNNVQESDNPLENILKIILKLMDFDSGGIYIVNNKTKTANLVTYKGFPPEIVQNLNQVKIDQDHYKQVFIDKEILMSENYHKTNPALAKKLNINSYVSIPLVFQDAVIGALNIASKSRYSFSYEEKTIFQSIGRQIGNIIARMRTEENLKESEKKFRSIFESIPMGLHYYELDKNENLIFREANPAADKILNIDHSQFVNKSIEEAFPPLIETDIPNRYRELARKKGTWKWDQVAYEYEKIKGAYEVHAFHTSPGKMVTSFNDITERLETDRKLKESEEMFRTIAEQSFMGIGIIQEDRIIYANEAIAKILEYSLDEIMSWTKSFNILNNIIHPEDLQMLREQRRRRRLGDFNLRPNSSYRIITRSGRIKWIDQYSKVIIYHGKEAELISIIDITEKKHAEEIILKENLNLMELNKMREDLITRVSHELKTPLTSIYGASQVLLNQFKEELDENVLNFVEISHRGGIRLKKLIENLIDTSKLKSGKLILNKTNEDLVAVVNECVEEMMFLAQNRNIVINKNLNNKIFLKVDKLRLEQAITNILSNAIKNTPSQGQIYVTIIETKNIVDICIRDTGIGITLEEKKLLFEKFGKIERYGMDLGVDIEGVGLGLFISKEIVELHGGQIIVESEGRNKGTEVTIKLLK